jgi:hypothetical protein
MGLRKAIERIRKTNPYLKYDLAPSSIGSADACTAIAVDHDGSGLPRRDARGCSGEIRSAEHAEELTKYQPRFVANTVSLDAALRIWTRRAYAN